MGVVHQGQSTGDTFAGYSDLEVTVCTCGVLFAAPSKLLNSRRETGDDFYCPNGHVLVFTDYENKRLKKKLDRERERSGRLAAELDQTEAARRAEKAAKTRIKQDRDRTRARIAEGVCPCCNRTFKDVARHMKSQHPDFRPGESDG